MKNKIFVVTHKQADFPESELYSPIFVGDNKPGNNGKVYLDSTGENIADKNPNYCELTALFWIWKNIDNYDNVGICHYRRYLKKSITDGFQDLLSNDDINEDLSTFDIIVPKKREFFTTTVYQQYFSFDNAFEKDYILLREVVNAIYPKYIASFDYVSKKHGTFLYNIFICNKKLLDEYCNWLFNILFEVEKRVDITGYNVQQKRIFGFLSERLLTVYIHHHKLKVKEYNVILLGNSIKKERKIILKNNVKKIINKLRGE